MDHVMEQQWHGMKQQWDVPWTISWSNDGMQWSSNRACQGAATGHITEQHLAIPWCSNGLHQGAVMGRTIV